LTFPNIQDGLFLGCRLASQRRLADHADFQIPHRLPLQMSDSDRHSQWATPVPEKLRVISRPTSGALTGAGRQMLANVELCCRAQVTDGRNWPLNSSVRAAKYVVESRNCYRLPPVRGRCYVETWARPNRSAFIPVGPLRLVLARARCLV